MENLNSEFLAIERQLAMVPMLIAAPAINFAAYIVIGSTVGWEYSGVTLLIWVIIVVVQHLC